MIEPFVIFAVPSFRGEPVREFHTSMAETQILLGARGIKYSMVILPGDPYIAKCRNRLMSQFLTEYPRATDMFFLDDDIGWPAEAALRLIQRDVPVVCGVYPHKKDDLTFPCELEADAAGELVRNGDLVSAVLAPTGFLRIKRHVLEQMAMASPRYHEKSGDGRTLLQWAFVEARYVDTELEKLKHADLSQLTQAEAVGHLRRALGLTVPSEIGGWWGEDYWFTARWRAMGGRVWVDTDIPFTHRGSKAWAATFGDSVRATVEMRKKAADEKTSSAAA